MANLDSMLKSRDTTLLTKDCIPSEGQCRLGMLGEHHRSKRMLSCRSLSWSSGPPRGNHFAISNRDTQQLGFTPPFKWAFL